LRNSRRPIKLPMSWPRPRVGMPASFCRRAARRTHSASTTYTAAIDPKTATTTTSQVGASSKRVGAYQSSRSEPQRAIRARYWQVATSSFVISHRVQSST
jgi:hypothetical protein